MSGEGGQSRLRVKGDRLTALADDLNAMQTHLDKQVKRMDAVVDSIEAGWQGPAAKGYRALHRGAAEDAVRIRMVIQRLEAGRKAEPRRVLRAGAQRGLLSNVS